MKYFLIAIALFVYPLCAMELTPLEQKCFDWFNQQPLKPEAFKMLSAEELKLFQTKSEDNSGVEQMLQKFVINLYDLLAEQHIQPSFKQDEVVQTLLKMKLGQNLKR